MTDKPKAFVITTKPHDFQTIRAEDTPLEFIEILYDDMTDEQKRIVDSGNEIAGTFPQGLSREEFSEWMTQRFEIAEPAIPFEVTRASLPIFPLMDRSSMVVTDETTDEALDLFLRGDYE